MIKSHPSVFLKFAFFAILIIIFQNSFAQSVLLVKANTDVYDSYKENKISLLKIKEETWVNFKGRYGQYFKISNYFGQDKLYPIGVFEGFVNINAILDTLSRDEYENIDDYNFDRNLTKGQKTTLILSENPGMNYDIENYFIGMNKSDLNANPASSMSLANFMYKIDTKFNRQNILSQIRLTGPDEDALAVDEIIKKQVYELHRFLEDKYGKTFKTSVYPSFLEIEENQIFNIASWRASGKLIHLGVGEHNDLYYSIASITAE